MILGLFGVLLALSTSVFAGDEASKGNTYVTSTITLKSKAMKPGSKGQVLITLKPEKGIHININPPIDVKFDSNGIVDSRGKLEVPRSKKTDYLDDTAPIRQFFTLKKKIKQGTMTIKGVLTYYFCSDAEGWCTKFKQPFDLAVTVKK